MSMAAVTVRRPPRAHVVRPRPRVVQLVPKLIGGGAEAVVRGLCGALPGEGIGAIAVSIYSSGLDSTAKAELGIDVIEVGRRNRADVGYFPRLLTMLRALDPDVVHAHLHTGQYAGRLAAVIAGVRAIVLTVHGEEPKSALRHTVDKYLDACTSRFVVFTESQRSSLARERGIEPRRIAVIPNGVAPPKTAKSRDDVRREVGIPPDAFALYVIGRLAPEKGHQIALAALAALRAAGVDDVYLAIAGDGGEREALGAFARMHGIAERVRFLGFRADAAALASGFDAFVMPSQRERMPIALGEAMLAGLVPIATPWAGVEDFIDDGRTGFIAGANSAEVLAAAIQRARHAIGDDDEVALGEFQKRIRQFAEGRFSFQAMVRRHAELYRNLEESAVPKQVTA